MKFILKVLLLVIVFCVVVIGCNDQEDTSTCPDGFTLINGDCICEGLDINGYCVSRCLPEDQQYIDQGQYGLFYNEEEWCRGFEELPQPMLLTLRAYVKNLDYAPVVIFGLNEAAFGLSLMPHLVTKDSFPNDTLTHFFIGRNQEAGFAQMELSNNPEMYTKEVNGETLHLRCYIKILHEHLLRVHFTWENSNDDIRETCTRIFHK